MEKLEKDIEPLREIMISIIDGIKLQFVFFIFSFFTSVQTWADTKRKEFEAWESRFVEHGLYELRKRPCQKLLKLLEEGRVFMKSIEEKGLKFDEQREDCAGLNKKFSDYHRTHNVFRDTLTIDSIALVMNMSESQRRSMTRCVQTVMCFSLIGGLRMNDFVSS